MKVIQAMMFGKKIISALGAGLFAAGGLLFGGGLPAANADIHAVEPYMVHRKSLFNATELLVE